MLKGTKTPFLSICLSFSLHHSKVLHFVVKFIEIIFHMQSKIFSQVSVRPAACDWPSLGVTFVEI